MGFITADILDILGLAFSIVGLAFIIPILFVFKQYFRFNTHMQFLYLFYIAFAPTAAIFSSYAEISWAAITQNFYIFCTHLTQCIYGTLSRCFNKWMPCYSLIWAFIRVMQLFWPFLLTVSSTFEFSNKL